MKFMTGHMYSFNQFRNTEITLVCMNKHFYPQLQATVTPAFIDDQVHPLEVDNCGVSLRNSRGGGHFSPGNFCWPTRKREAKKKGKMEKERKMVGGKLKMEGGKVTNWEEDFFFFFFAFTFENHRNLLCV